VRYKGLALRVTQATLIKNPNDFGIVPVWFGGCRDIHLNVRLNASPEVAATYRAITGMLCVKLISCGESMATVGLADAEAAFSSQMNIPKAAPAAPSDMVTGRFSDAMQKALVDAGVSPSAVQSSDTANKVAGVEQTNLEGANKSAPANAEERARRGLGLEAPNSTNSTQGDSILNGLQKIRGMFDAHQVDLKTLLSHSAASTTTLMAMQMEVTNFSLLCTITSELAGKSTQAFEALLKGQ
jgi:hypothetical protein